MLKPSRAGLTCSVQTLRFRRLEVGESRDSLKCIIMIAKSAYACAMHVKLIDASRLLVVRKWVFVEAADTGHRFLALLRPLRSHVSIHPQPTTESESCQRPAEGPPPETALGPPPPRETAAVWRARKTREERRKATGRCSYAR